MKSFKQIIFLSTFFMIGMVCGMEKEKKSIADGHWYVELDSKQNAQLVKHVGGRIGYYGQYDVQRDKNNNSMLFPVKLIDFLPIRHCSNKKFFITSATEEKKGSALTILDPAITQLVVVRGFVNKNGCKVNLYLGLEANNFEFCGKDKCDRIYSARIMTVQIPNWDLPYAPVKSEVEDFGIMTEVRQALDKPKDNKSLIYTHQIKSVLGISGTFANHFDFKKQCFNFNENYLSDKEKPLKTMTHK